MKWMRTQVVRALRWSEQYTKTDMLYITKGMSWMTFGKVFGAGATFLSAVAFANLLPPETYGEYRYILTMLNFLAIPTLSGINAALTRSVVQGNDASIFKAFQTRLSFGLFGAGAGLLISAYYLYRGNESLALGMLFVSLLTPFFYSMEVYVAFLKGKRLFKTLTTYTTTAMLISTATLVVALFLTESVPLLVASYFGPYLIVRTIFYRKTLKLVKNQKKDEEMVRYGKHLSLMGVLNSVATNLDQFLLWHMLGAAPVAIYTLALAPVKQLTNVLSSFQNLVFPKLAESSIPHIKSVVLGKMVRTLIPLVFLIGLYILLAPYLFALLFPQYTESILFSQVMALALLFFPISTFLSETFTAHAKVREKYYLSLITSVGKIILLIVLVPMFGIWGAIWSELIMRVVESLATVLFFRKL